ncbi:hemagglutinin, partial [Escherichia coli]|nr:hemagglutinin [Escherichia coli]
MNLRKKHICIAISLVLNPASISQVYAQADTNTLTVEVDEATPGSDVHGDDWKSIEIGTTQFAAKDVSKGINFDHKSPVAEGRNSIAIGTSALAGDKMKDMKTGEAISIGAKANAAREQSLAIGADTKATGWGAIVIGGDDLTPLHGKTYGRGKIDNNYLASEAQGDGSIALGSRTFAKGELSVSLGSVSSAEGVASNAIGATAEAKGNMATAVGFNALANAGNALAVGSHSSANKNDALAVGSEANAGQNETVALGHGATVTVAKGNVSIGADSRDKQAQKVTEAKVRTKRGTDVTYNGFAGTNAESVVSVGATDKERQIVNVGAGAISDTSTDAINGSQLYAIAKTLKDDLDAINPTWTLKDDKGGSATINGGKDNKNGNTLTVKGDGDIAVTVNDKGMTIDGTKLTENIKTDAIKIKDNNGGLLKKDLSDEIEITGKGPIKTQVAGDKLEISAETASLPVNGGNGKITVNSGDNDKLVTAKNIADAINQSGWKIKADKDTGGVIGGNGQGTETLIKPGDMVTLKAGKNLSVKQSGGEFTFSVIDTPSFSSVQLNGNGKNGNVTLSSEGNKLTLSGGNNGAGQNGVVISGVASGLNNKDLAGLKAGDAEMKNTASVADLKTAIDGVSTSMQGAGFALKDSKGQEVKQSLGQAIKVSGDSNITTTAITANGDKGLKISLNNDLTVGDKAPGSIKVNGADGKEAVSLNGQDGTIKLTSSPAAGGKSASATIAVNAGKGGLTDAVGTTKTRLTYTPDGKSPAEELATMNDGLSFEGDDGKVIHKKLNEKLTIKGGAEKNAEVTDGNIRVDNDNGGLLVRMTRNLRDLASAVFGTGGQITTVNDKGITITTPAAGGGQGDTVSLTGSGLNNGGNQITSVASGLNGTALADASGDVLNNAANIGDLKNALRDSSAALVNTGFGLQADDGSKVNTSLGKHITVGGDGQNISTTVQNGSLTVRLADNIRLADDGSVSVGGTRMDKNGLTIKDGPSVTVNGIDAAGRVISGVKDGVNDQDAVNVSQLNREISQATAATTWALKTESGDEAVAVSSQTVEVRHGQNTRVSAISKDDKGNYSYEIDVTGIPVEYTDSQGNPLVNIGGRFYTQTEDAATGKLTMTPAEPARVRISSEQPLVLTNVAAGNVSPVS